MLQKAVLRLDLHEEKTKKKAMKTVSRLPGIKFSFFPSMIHSYWTRFIHSSKLYLVTWFNSKLIHDPNLATCLITLRCSLAYKSRLSLLKYLFWDEKLAGVHSISMEMKDQKLTVVGDIDPVNIVAKLRKLCCTEIVTVGPEKEPEKKKEEPKKEEPKKKDQDQDPVAYQAYNPHMPPYYYARSVEEDPNAICVIS